MLFLPGVMIQNLHSFRLFVIHILYLLGDRLWNWLREEPICHGLGHLTLSRFLQLLDPLFGLCCSWRTMTLGIGVLGLSVTLNKWKAFVALLFDGFRGCFLGQLIFSIWLLNQNLLLLLPVIFYDSELLREVYLGALALVVVEFDGWEVSYLLLLLLALPRGAVHRFESIFLLVEAGLDLWGSRHIAQLFEVLC